MNELKGLDEGLTNLGFDLYEAIMESIEDSIDANANNITIEIFNEEIDIKVCDKTIKSERISYLIKDNGNGIENLSEVFNFGEHKEERFQTIEELKVKNGIYHYGAISHLNVGVFVTLYSKTENGIWKEINVYYDQYNRKAFIDDEKPLHGDSIDKMKILCRSQIPSTSGSIIYVRGVSKDNIVEAKDDITEIEENIDSGLDEESNIEKIVKLLTTKIGIRYKVSLENEIKPIEILVNNTNVKAKDIFLQGKELPDNLRTAGEPFTSYEISLKQIIDKLKDDAKYEILYHRYGGIFESREKFLEEHITIDFYALSSEYKVKKIQIIYRSNGYLIPSTYYSGLFVRRNNIYMGSTAKIMNIFNVHPSFNNLRGEIRFSPIFDEFFEIQINKNKYRIVNSLETLIEKAIIEDDKLIGKTAKAKISNALIGKFNTEKATKENDLELQFTQDTRDRIKKSKDELKKYKDLMSSNLINENILIKLKNELDKLSRLNIKHKEEHEVIELIKNVNKEINKYKKIYKKVDYDFITDFRAFENRVNKLNERKKLILEDNSNENYSLIGGIREPKNEAEMYGILILLLKMNPDLFEFDILDYDYKDSLDNVIEVEEDVFKELKMEDRFNGKIEDINDINDVLNDNLDIIDIIEYKKYCFMEMKMEIPKTMNHSMRFVSHIVCWTRNNMETMDTDYVSYDIDNEKDILLFNNEPRVKIIYLKELLEKELRCTFE